ncbi:MAG TPA: ATP synthase F1 subunit epsilon [Patescibacteria group bacterium]
MKINFEITTPEKIAHKDQIDSVTVPTKMGQITILPNHIPLVSSLVAGELIVRKDGQETPLAVSGGFVNVQPNNRVVILADTAEKVEEIDEELAERARQRAAELLKTRREDAEDYAVILGELNKEMARLKLLRKYRRLKTK